MPSGPTSRSVAPARARSSTVPVGPGHHRPAAASPQHQRSGGDAGPAAVRRGQRGGTSAGPGRGLRRPSSQHECRPAPRVSTSTRPQCATSVDRAARTKADPAQHPPLLQVDDHDARGPRGRRCTAGGPRRPRGRAAARYIPGQAEAERDCRAEARPQRPAPDRDR